MDARVRPQRDLGRRHTIIRFNENVLRQDGEDIVDTLKTMGTDLVTGALAINHRPRKILGIARPPAVAPSPRRRQAERDLPRHHAGGDGRTLHGPGLNPRHVYRLDGGASSKIAFIHQGNTHVAGSLHYLRWPRTPQEPFSWRGLDGRVLHSAFLITSPQPRGADEVDTSPIFHVRATLRRFPGVSRG
ncbi:hypothetical protein ACWCQ1_50840 [Streptomyces sp. NPDC002144]